MSFVTNIILLIKYYEGDQMEDKLECSVALRHASVWGSGCVDPLIILLSIS
jgi:hypothetical protein